MLPKLILEHFKVKMTRKSQYMRTFTDSRKDLNNSVQAAQKNFAKFTGKQSLKMSENVFSRHSDATFCVNLLLILFHIIVQIENRVLIFFYSFEIAQDML